MSAMHSALNAVHWSVEQENRHCLHAYNMLTSVLWSGHVCLSPTFSHVYVMACVCVYVSFRTVQLTRLCDQFGLARHNKIPVC